MINIEESMRICGVGVTELAERMGVNRQTVYYYIKQGDRNPVYQLQKIADALKIDVADLFEKEQTNIITCPNCGKRFKME